MIAPLLTRLDARDRALFVRLALDGRRAHALSNAWRVLTHLGGARWSIALCLLSVFMPGGTWGQVWRALVLLGASHLLVQVVKRFALRERPTSTLSFQALVSVPDRFSFPSGHSCAAMAVALAYAALGPSLAIPVLVLALLVGLSRVVLGVHYPGDVLVGQAIALLTAWGLHRIW